MELFYKIIKYTYNNFLYLYICIGQCTKYSLLYSKYSTNTTNNYSPEAISILLFISIKFEVVYSVFMMCDVVKCFGETS